MRCLLQAHRTYGDVDDPDALPAYLKQTLVNCAQDHLRAEGRESRERSLQGLDDDPLYPTSTSVGPFPSSGVRLDLLSGFDIDDLDAVLARLQAVYRMPLVLMHMEGYTIAEVADLLDTSQDTVLSRLHRGRQQFERQLWDYGQERGLLVDMRPNSGRAQPST